MRCLITTLTILFVVGVFCGLAFSETPNDPYAIDDGNYADGLLGGGDGHYIAETDISEVSAVEQGSQVADQSCGWWGHCNAWSLVIPMPFPSLAIILGTDGLEALVYIPHF